MATSEHHRESGVGAIFDRMAGHVARWCGHAGAFVFAVVIILVWIVSGPIFHFSDTWQLVINTGTTVLTFLMVFLIQNSINRDSMAVHLKLDELLRTTTEARNALIGAEELPERDITDLEEPNREVAQKPAAS